MSTRRPAADVSHGPGYAPDTPAGVAGLARAVAAADRATARWQGALDEERKAHDRTAAALREAAPMVPCDAAPGECKAHDRWRAVLAAHAEARRKP